MREKQNMNLSLANESHKTTVLNDLQHVYEVLSNFHSLLTNINGQDFLDIQCRY